MAFGAEIVESTPLIGPVVFFPVRASEAVDPESPSFAGESLTMATGIRVAGEDDGAVDCGREGVLSMSFRDVCSIIALSGRAS